MKMPSKYISENQNQAPISRKKKKSKNNNYYDSIPSKENDICDSEVYQHKVSHKSKKQSKNNRKMKEHASSQVLLDKFVNSVSSQEKADICQRKKKKIRKLKLRDIRSDNLDNINFNDSNSKGCINNTTVTSKQNKVSKCNKSFNSELSLNVHEKCHDTGNKVLSSGTDKFDDFIVGDNVIEYEGRPVNRHRRIIDSDTEDSPQKIKKEEIILYEDESETDDEVAKFFDREALEFSEESETDGEYEEENIRFQGGSMLPGTNSPKKSKQVMSSIFDLYDVISSDEEGDDSEMEDFIETNNDLSDSKSIISQVLNKLDSKKRKRRRIKSETDSDKEDICTNSKKSKLNSTKKSFSLHAKPDEEENHMVSNDSNKIYQIYRTPAEYKLTKNKPPMKKN